MDIQCIGYLRAGMSYVSTEHLIVLTIISFAIKPNVTKQNSDKVDCVILFIPELKEDITVLVISILWGDLMDARERERDREMRDWAGR